MAIHQPSMLLRQVGGPLVRMGVLAVLISLLPWWVVFLFSILTQLYRPRWEYLIPLVAADVWFGAQARALWVPLYTLGGVFGTLINTLLQPILLPSSWYSKK